MRTIGGGMARLAAMAALALGALLASAEAAAQSRLFYISQTGDVVGNGQVADLREDQGWTFQLLTSYTDFAVMVSDGAVQHFFVRLGGPGGAPLTPGVYENATGAAFRDATRSGIEISGSPGSCGGAQQGRFVVHEAVHAGGVYTKFAADFEQQCEGGSGAIHGQIRFAVLTGHPALTETDFIVV